MMAWLAKLLPLQRLRSTRFGNLVPNGTLFGICISGLTDYSRIGPSLLNRRTAHLSLLGSLLEIAALNIQCVQESTPLLPLFCVSRQR